MAGVARTVTRLLLLLLSFITTGLNGQDGLIFPERAYDVTAPCGEIVCFYIWQISTRQSSDYVVIIHNGEIRAAQSEDEETKCILQIKDLTVDDVGYRHCQRAQVNSPHAQTSPELNLMPGKTVSLQCIFPMFIEERHCYMDGYQVRLTWVDEAGTEIQEDSQHQIKRESRCAVTLTVNIQSAENEKKFKCQATMGRRVQTSVALTVKFPGVKGKGRGLDIDLGAENEGGNQDVVGIAVGVVACVVLTALVALFVVNRRRRNSQLQNESCNSIGTDAVIDADDVIYADIILPVGPDRVWEHEGEDTEYACVR